MKELPQEYLNNMKEILKEDLDDYLDSFNNPRSYGLRINTGKISVEEFLKISPFNLKPIPWCSDGFYYSSDDEPSKHSYYYAGLYYLQEPSAMLPAEILPIEIEDKVLDACAAPGGKSAKLANKLQETGLLICNDISVSRQQVLLKTIETHGITNSIVMAEDLNKLDRFNTYFDKILLDAPCSGEGMFRKEPQLIKSWIEKGNDYYANIQKQLIIKALEMLKDGGMLVYSTCTFSMKENEEVIEYAMNYFPELKVLPIKKYAGFSDGLTEKTKNCARLYPHKIQGEGHFVALLQKGDNKVSNNNINTVAKLPDYPFFKNIDINISNKELINRNNKLYLNPVNNINLEGLRILRSGIYLGEIKHDKFEPSYALAMCLKSYPNILNLDRDDQRVIKYLKGETLNIKEDISDGYVLICVDNFPLGFGLINKGILKNKYPSSYRYK